MPYFALASSFKVMLDKLHTTGHHLRLNYCPKWRLTGPAQERATQSGTPGLQTATTASCIIQRCNCHRDWVWAMSWADIFQIPEGYLHTCSVKGRGTDMSQCSGRATIRPITTQEMHWLRPDHIKTSSCLSTSTVSNWNCTGASVENRNYEKNTILKIQATE